MLLHMALFHSFSCSLLLHPRPLVTCSLHGALAATSWSVSPLGCELLGAGIVSSEMVPKGKTGTVVLTLFGLRLPLYS